ncbi:hypothetical protein [Natronospira sp.]|uniref:hypothetical protein n=1 Tax=Natronospira sp. TaxID=2024970 RepID=UPI003872C466
MSDEQPLPSIDRLEALIGRQVHYLGHDWQVIEILEEELAIVLQATDNSERILANAHGEPVRALPDVITLPVADPDGGGLNPALREMQVSEQ